MHAILDFVELLWTESMDAETLAQFNREMYRVDTLDSEGGLIAIPAGFERDDELASFDAFAQIAGEA